MYGLIYNPYKKIDPNCHFTLYKIIYIFEQHLPICTHTRAHMYTHTHSHIHAYTRAHTQMYNAHTCAHAHTRCSGPGTSAPAGCQ